MEKGKTTGQLIKLARKKAGLTQVELGKKLGVTSAAISQFERTNANPTFETLDKIADALGVDVWELYEGYGLKPARHNGYFGTAYLDDKLKQLGYSIGYYEEDASLWINYPDGTLEVTEENLKELDKSTVSYLQFKLEELKRKHPEDFKPLKK